MILLLLIKISKQQCLETIILIRFKYYHKVTRNGYLDKVDPNELIHGVFDVNVSVNICETRI